MTLPTPSTPPSPGLLPPAAAAAADAAAAAEICGAYGKAKVLYGLTTESFPTGAREHSLSAGAFVTDQPLGVRSVVFGESNATAAMVK